MSVKVLYGWSQEGTVLTTLKNQNGWHFEITEKKILASRKS